MPPAPSTIAPRSTATTAVKAPPASTNTNDVSLHGDVQAARLIPHRQGDRAELVGGAHVDAVDLAVLRDRGEMHDAGGEADRQTALLERPQQTAHAADDRPPRPIRGIGQQHEVELLRAEVADVRPWQAVPRGADDEVHGTGGAQHGDQRLRVTAHLGGGIGGVQEAVVAVPSADVEADRPGVDADRPRHDERSAPSGSALRYPQRSGDSCVYFLPRRTARAARSSSAPR